MDAILWPDVEHNPAPGVHAMSEEAHRQFGIKTAHHGYIRK